MSEGPSLNQPVVIGIHVLESWAWLHQTLFVLYNHNSFRFRVIRNHLGKAIRDVLDYAVSNTGTELLSVKIPENIKMPNVITKAIVKYRQCALSIGHLYHIRLVAKSKESLLFLEKYFKRLK